MADKGLLPHKELLFWFGTPSWFIAIALAMCLAIALFTGYIGFVLQAPHDGAEESLHYFLQLLSLIFFYLFLTRWNKEKWTTFYATREGFVFPDKHPLSRRTVWLTIPWGRVNAIEAKRLYGRKDGICIRLQLQREELESHFRNDALTKQFFGAVYELEDYPVCMANGFMKPELVVPRLNQLRTLYRRSGGEGR